MGDSVTKPSSAVQQSANLEALDQYIDYDWDGNVRKCLLDKNGKRVLDSNGSPKTLRHKFNVYCDDIAAGANSLNELYDLYEALLLLKFRRMYLQFKPISKHYIVQQGV